MLTNDVVIRDAQNSLVHEAPKRNSPAEGGWHPLFFLLQTAFTSPLHN